MNGVRAEPVVKLVIHTGLQPVAWRDTYLETVLAVSVLVATITGLKPGVNEI